MTTLMQSTEPAPRDPPYVIAPEAADTIRLEALGLMTAGIVHDLGNTVQILQSALALIARHPEVRTADGLEPIVSGATTSLEQAGALVEQILSFARNDGTAAEPVDLPLCFARLERLLRWICGYDVALQTAIAVDLPELVCNRHNLENAILNLVINARDATAPGGEIAIRGRSYYDATIGDCVSLSVSDTGQGMPSDIAARAFEPFFTTKPRGSGLGLAMVKRFADETGGYIALESSPGHGTIIDLRLPVAAKD